MEVLGTEDLLGMGEKGEDMGGKEDGEGGSYLVCSPTSCSSHSYCSSAATQMMLCFGGDEQEEDAALMMNGVPLKSSDSSLTTLCSSPPSTTTTTTTTCSSSKASKKVETEGRGRRRAAAATTTTTTTASSCKKTKTEVSARPGTIKVRKEKLGDRISALQQLVSPFGKTDTASVLHEALGYIRFLHEQVQVLSSPYLQRLPSSTHLQARQTSRLNENLQEGGGGPRRSDLRSRGLCLVPVSCTEHVANTSSNGADLWAPVMGSSMQPFSSKH